jgi:hypothetical protein
MTRILDVAALIGLFVMGLELALPWRTPAHVRLGLAIMSGVVIGVLAA